MDFGKVEFYKSVFSEKGLPEPLYPEIAFAGKSNVGKSSLINRLVNRRNYVKTSSKPGKTQSLNYFIVDELLYVVDLPGYGFAKVSKKTREAWERLITGYLVNRETLACVVVIIDLRHSLKEHDRNMIDWLRYHGIDFVLVYTKADKLSANRQQQHAAALDVALGIKADQRVLFSAKTGQGCEDLKSVLDSHLER